MQSISLQDTKLVVKRIVDEIYSRIQHHINSIDAADRVLVAIIKALISLNNEPSSPRQLAACIQKYGFTQLGGQTPYATVSGHISTHFSRVRQQIVPRPIIGKQPHPAIAKRSLYYFLDPDNDLKDLLAEHFQIGESSPSYQTQLTPSSPTTNESIISEDQYYAETPPSTPSSCVKEVEEDKSISDNENDYPGRKIFTQNATYTTKKGETVEPVAAFHDIPSDIKGKKKRSYDIGERNGFTPPSSPSSHNYLTFPYFIPQIPPRNPGSARVPLTPDIHIMKLNGLEVFTTKIKTGQNEFVLLLRRVDNNCVDKYSLLQAGGRRARNSDRKWITLEEAQTLASELNIVQNLGIFLYARLSDYFDVELDYVTIANGRCYPLTGFSYWFQCVSPKKILLE